MASLAEGSERTVTTAPLGVVTSAAMVDAPRNGPPYSVMTVSSLIVAPGSKLDRVRVVRMVRLETVCTSAE